MPNHCYNEIKADKKILEELYSYKDKKITFNNLIPMPKEIENTEADGSSKTKKALYLYINGNKDLLEERWDNNKDLQKQYGTIENLVEKMIEKYSIEEINRSYKCLQKYGADNWYDWSIKNWGTKWDAYDFQGSPEEGVLIFSTAWNPPMEVVKELCKRYPESNIDWYYEEETNQFKGHFYSGKNGEVIDEEINVEEYNDEDDMEM